MSKIYITGDVHGDIDFGKLTTSRFPEQKQLTNRLDLNQNLALLRS